ncbi:MAG TPA: AMP-binding protein [Thermodesulfobacteriota bacterium]|nr:AMP-binding protein [Thermodesulfobacteriota bacterium]
MIEFPKYRAKDIRHYTKNRWWLGLTLGDILDRTADVFPNKEALVDDRVRLTYSELRGKVDRLATGLMNLGIEKGDTVLLQLPNWAEYVYSYFALQKIGCIPIVLISGYRQIEVSHLALLTEAKAWIVPDQHRKVDYLSFIGAVMQKTPQLQRVISVRTEEGKPGFSASLEGLMERGATLVSHREMIRRKPRATDVAHIIPSGGTTGFPKGIPRTHNDYICNVEYLHKAWEMNVKEVSLVVVPVGHNLALLNVVGAVLTGYKLVLLDSTKPRDVCSIIEREKVTYMPTVPSVVRRILESEQLHDYDLSSLKKISAGGEPSAPDLIREVYKQLNCTYINEFGMSEGLLCRTSLTDDIETICNTVGKPCCPYEQIKIVNGTGHALSADQEGELVTKGPGIFAGYLKNPEENAKSFLRGGFFRTGDRAKLDRSGNLKITGRTKDIIIRGGENISPALVEEILCSHAGIADAAVIGMPDKALGEKVCAYVRPVEGVKVDPEEIKSFMESQGASKLLIPERFEFVTALPLTEAGKHDKRALKEDIKQKMG